ncbi:GCN5-like protein 1 (GCN5L1) family member [Spironucleus salmonicida]|uniref:GCN5-like protein 1 (GCN5L1) family member n=1 Tax=Spironucleus salmonicida TaxID=348837 RepID=V6M760_9EUKA|nr:GCN5-like protein 1 (GCN5L1) family member [Spironucleus salmonicida]|eukprot:EST49259.1 GCN5-like protein 1 (GCN5L1) family member [Spironucleus salmonicida]
MSITAAFNNQTMKANTEKATLIHLQKGALASFSTETAQDKIHLDSVVSSIITNQKTVEQTLLRVADQEVKFQKQALQWQQQIDKYALALKQLGDAGLSCSVIVNDLIAIRERM